MGTVADYIAAKKKKNPDLRIGSLRKISESQKYPPLSTNNLVLDYVTSIGGIPRGVVTEIRGINSSGKTTLAAQAAAQHQQAVYRGETSGAVLFLDFEYAVSEPYFKALGINTDDEETFIYYQPDTLEDGFNMFLEMTKERMLAMCIVDSVAGASSEAEYEGSIGKLSVGLKARGMHQALRMCVGPMKVTGTGLVLINHTQVKIPQTYGEKMAAQRGIQDKISPGGKAIEYYTSLRIDLAQTQLVKNEAHDELTNDKTKQVTSVDVTAYAFKNKLGTPHRSGKMRVLFGHGFSQPYSAFHILVDHGYIKKKAAGRYDFPEQLVPTTADFKVPVGEDKIVAAIENNPEWEKLIVNVAREVVLREQVEPSDVDIVISEETEDGEFIDPDTGEVLTGDE